MTRRPTLRFARRIASLMVMAVLGALVFIGGPSGTTQPAEALSFCPGFLKAEDAPLPAGYRVGVEAMTGNVGPNGREDFSAFALAKPYGNKKITVYENFGSGGLKWSRYDKGCGSALVGGMQNLVANQLFGFSTAFTSMTIGMYAWATDPDLLKSFMKPVGCVVKGCSGSKGLDDALYLNFLTPIIVLGALWAGWTGLVKRSTTQAWQGGLWMVGSAAFALFFMANPTGVAETGNDIVSNANAITASAVTSATSSATAKDDICYIPEDSPDYGVRTSSCSIWKALAYTPWATGQFGVSESTALPDKKNKGKCVISGKAWNDMRMTQLCSQTISHDEAMSGTFASRGGGLADKVIAKAGGKEEIWKNLADQNGEKSSWAGTDAGFRVNIAFASLIANIAAGLIIMLISFSNVVLALAMVLLIMAAPIFLLLGAHPGVGRGIALKWLELLLGTVVKRVILGFMLALLIGMYQIIISVEMAWMGKIALIIAVSVAGMIYRKPMMEALNVVNLGGTQTGIEQGGAEAAQKGSSMAAGAGSSGIGAAMAGGGIGAVAGSMLGGAMQAKGGSSNPALRAGKQGLEMGKSRGAKSAEARAARRAPKDEPPMDGPTDERGKGQPPGTPSGGSTPRPSGGPTSPPADASGSPTPPPAPTPPSAPTPRADVDIPAPRSPAPAQHDPARHDPGGLDLAREIKEGVAQGLRQAQQNPGATLPTRPGTTPSGGQSTPPPTPK